jgi:hypothetical protein
MEGVAASNTATTTSTTNNTNMNSNNAGPEQQLELASHYCAKGRHLWSKGDKDSALEKFQSALVILESILGTFHVLTAKTYYWIGFILKHKSELSTSLIAFRKTMKIRLLLLGSDHTSTLEASTAVEWILKEKGISANEIQHYLDALQQGVELEKEADICMRTHLFADACEKYETCLELELEVLQSGGGAVQMDQTELLRKLAVALQRLALPEKSLVHYRKCLGMYVQEFGPTHEATLQLCERMGTLVTGGGGASLGEKEKEQQPPVVGGYQHSLPLSIGYELEGKRLAALALADTRGTTNFGQAAIVQFGKALAMEEPVLGLDHLVVQALKKEIGRLEESAAQSASASASSAIAAAARAQSLVMALSDGEQQREDNIKDSPLSVGQEVLPSSAFVYDIHHEVDHDDKENTKKDPPVTPTKFGILQAKCTALEHQVQTQKDTLARLHSSSPRRYSWNIDREGGSSPSTHALPPASPSRTSAFAAAHSPCSNSNNSTNDIMMAKALQSHRKKSQRAEEQMEKLKIKVDFLQTDKTLLLQQKKELLQRLKEQQNQPDDGDDCIERETLLSDRTNAMSPGSVESFSSAFSQQLEGDLQTEIGFLHERLLQAEQDKNAEVVMLRNSKLIVETLQNELQVAHENTARAKQQLEAQMEQQVGSVTATTTVDGAADADPESAAGRSVTRLESENQSLVAQLGKLETDLAQVETQLKTAEETRMGVACKNETLSTQVGALESAAHLVQEQVTSMQHTLEQTAVQLTQAQTDKVHAEELLEESKTQMDTKVTSTDAHIDDLEMQLRESQDQAKSLLAEKESSTMKIAENELGKADAERQLLEADSHIDELEMQLRESQDQAEALLAEKESLSLTTSMKNAENELAKADVERQLLEADSDKVRITTTLQESKSQVLALQLETREFVNRMVQIESEKSNLDNSLKQANGKCATLQDETDNLKVSRPTLKDKPNLFV